MSQDAVVRCLYMVPEPIADAEPTGKHPDEALLMGLYPSLRRFAAVVAPAEVAPDDLVQDALVMMLRRGPISGVAEPGAYLRRSMVNLASNHRRRLGRARHAARRLHLDVSALDSYPSDLDHLAVLRPEARAVLYMQHVEGHTSESIARVLGLSDDAVRQIAVRARRELRDHIEQQEG
jgi:DNA-directed RNA polymerase specialized sigma24 family protein